MGVRVWAGNIANTPQCCYSGDGIVGGGELWFCFSPFSTLTLFHLLCEGFFNGEWHIVTNHVSSILVACFCCEGDKGYGF